MPQQRQHILLSYFETLCAGKAGFEPATSRDLPLGTPALINWANRVAVLYKHLLQDAVERSVSIAMQPLKFLNNDLEFSFIP